MGWKEFGTCCSFVVLLLELGFRESSGCGVKEG